MRARSSSRARAAAAAASASTRRRSSARACSAAVGGGGLEPGALFFTRALDGGRHRRFGLEQGPLLFSGALGGGGRLGAEPPDVFLAFALEHFRFRLGLLPAQRFVQRPLRRFLRLDAQPLGFEAVGIGLAAQPLFALLGFAAQVLGALFGLEPQRVDLLALPRRLLLERHHLQALGLGLRRELALPLGFSGAVVVG